MRDYGALVLIWGDLTLWVAVPRRYVGNVGFMAVVDIISTSSIV